MMSEATGVREELPLVVRVGLANKPIAQQQIRAAIRSPNPLRDIVVWLSSLSFWTPFLTPALPLLLSLHPSFPAWRPILSVKNGLIGSSLLLCSCYNCLGLSSAARRVPCCPVIFLRFGSEILLKAIVQWSLLRLPWRQPREIKSRKCEKPWMTSRWRKFTLTQIVLSNRLMILYQEKD
ncbi:hypothetical protein H6P81_019605 [Aristolochia fimbriata]|uniref:Uncharacterized protein n=1 Tax=Aristolochia fimbriata TaxID=158543 RepID=A0AAV7DS60_ARIFI|nr:hypothetical protein H6P81_019605 [Aristolochia fimbriata]